MEYGTQIVHLTSRIADGDLKDSDDLQAGLDEDPKASSVKCAKEKNRQAQRRFRERQKGLIQQLKDKNDAYQKTVSLRTHSWPPPSSQSIYGINIFSTYFIPRKAALFCKHSTSAVAHCAVLKCNELVVDAFCISTGTFNSWILLPFVALVLPWGPQGASHAGYLLSRAVRRYFVTGSALDFALISTSSFCAKDVRLLLLKMGLPLQIEDQRRQIEALEKEINIMRVLLQEKNKA